MVAQKAATVALLSEGRLTLGLGENLGEHVVGQGWQPANVRHEKLVEAVGIVKQLFAGGYVNFRGLHFDVDSAKLWDLPDEPVEIGIAVSGQQSCTLAGEHADLMIAVEPKAELGEMFDAAGGRGRRRVGQLATAYDPVEDAATRRAHEQFRWFGLGWKVNAELPRPAAFEAATQFVTPDDVAAQIPCGASVERFVEGGARLTPSRRATDALGARLMTSGGD